MSKDRINVDGTWYVKESSVFKESEVELIDSRCITGENESICIEFSVLEEEKDGETVYSMPSFDVKHKDGSDKEEFWDSEGWMLRYNEGDDVALAELFDISDECKLLFKKMLVSAIEKGYISKKR